MTGPISSFSSRLSWLRSLSFGGAARRLLPFAAGLLLGWFVLGWAIFPVTWTGAYPVDLRADVSADYWQLVADSYALTGSEEMAARRLQYWPDTELGPLLATVIDRTEMAGDRAAADRLRALAQALSLPMQGGNVAADGASTGLDLRWLLYLAIAALVVAVAALLGPKLRERIAKRLGRVPAAAASPAPTPADTASARAASPVAATPAARIVGGAPPPPVPTSPPGQRTAGGPFTAPTTPPPAGAWDGGDEEEDTEEDFGDDEDADWVEEEEEEEESPSFATPAASVQTAERLSFGGRDVELVTSIRFEGDPRHNEIFPIEPAGEYLGEYGFSAAEYSAYDPNQIFATEIWLFDKRDVHTVKATLVHPEMLERATAEWGAGRNVVVPMQVGARIHLQTMMLEVVGQVRRVEFGLANSEGVPLRRLELDLTGRPR